MAKNIRYPEEAFKNKIEEKVFLSFIVEMDGELTSVHIDRGVGGGIDEEALRIIKESPRWQAGIYGSKPVRVKYNIPISFALNEPRSGEQKPQTIQINPVN